VSLPECQGATHTTHTRYPRWMPLQEKHFHRRKSGYHVYLNARPDPSDEARLTWTGERYEAYRMRTAGPLAGWYGALALGRKTAVSYNETQALVCSAETLTAWVPLPPKAKLKNVTRLLHDGTEEEYEHIVDKAGKKVKLYIEDCGGEVFLYRLRYTL